MNERPLYRVIAENLEARIAAGRYPPSTLLPPEPMLETEFGVSRITVRKALALLKQRGIVRSQSGKGTLVRGGALANRAMRVTGTLNDLRYYAAKTIYKPLDRTLVDPTPLLVKMLELGEGESVVRFRGLRGQSREHPFAFEETYIPQSLSAGVDNKNLGERTLFSLLEKANALQIAEVRQEISAVRAPPFVRRDLKLSSNAPILQATRTYFTQNVHPVEFSISYYDAEKFTYVMTLYAD